MEVVHHLAQGPHRMCNGLDFISITQLDEVTEVVLYHGQVIQMIPDAGGQHLLVSAANDALSRCVRGHEEQVEGDLIDLYQEVGRGVRPVHEEIDMTTRLTRIAAKLWINRGGTAQISGAPHEVNDTGCVPRRS